MVGNDMNAVGNTLKTVGNSLNAVGFTGFGMVRTVGNALYAVGNPGYFFKKYFCFFSSLLIVNRIPIHSI